MKTERRIHVNTISKERINRDSYPTMKNYFIFSSLNFITLLGIKGYMNYRNYISNDPIDSNLSDLSHLCSFALGLSTYELINSYSELKNIKGVRNDS